jgi:predicted DCC family thiol-disulfide oxidoreductase YuxK
MTEYHIILYDGVCGLCDRLTRLVIRHDRRRQFRFAPLQGAFAARVLSRYGRDPRDLDTLYVIHRYGTPSESLLSKSEAVFFVLRELGGVWRLARALRWLPTSLVDHGYRLVARHRYRVFGRYDACPVPEPSDRDRFIEAEDSTSGGSRSPGLFVNH